jgi:hypothetical protein
LGILTALLGFALVAVGEEEFGSKENWTAPAAEAQKKNAVAVTVLAKPKCQCGPFREFNAAA